MEKLDLEAQDRVELGNKNKSLRKKGVIPAVIYGHGIKSRAIAIEWKSFLKTIGTKAGSNAIITLKVGKDNYPVITHEVQKDATNDHILHVDFFKINMDEAIKAKVHIELKGVPTGVKDDGGILVLKLREIEVKCLPSNIPEKFEVDVTGLKLGESLLVSDIKASEGIEFITPANEAIANVAIPAKEEEIAPAPEAGAAVTPEAGAAVPVEGAAKAVAPVAPAAKPEAKKPEAKK
ncbi:50S ribosomal protein L25 [Candidatus Saganbacteria bacterium]|nr:50S ribosomal protein L25 [Candidatus Saganbacteria bacterium]